MASTGLRVPILWQVASDQSKGEEMTLHIPIEVIAGAVVGYALFSLLFGRHC